ncbi:MAG: bifunctional DNA-formamidopyrimidine glycosylase/DNA-(apurinic or apyrimidinic site) lyase [Candidatus Thiodiazotropha sp. (ex Gloverina cf. vestifex)]|nr:bifunctional DNA-formamidopyrimidine glycosylase/DNA-(apurinic or apyrimidinic site) lyase [Candidatus Thiodiazotropha sp. (ex Gloverina cf. vestifex)]
MPELPEVETTRRGIAPHLTGARINGVIIREPRLRWPIPDELPKLLKGRKILSVSRRGKYLLIGFHHGTLLIHLGMSGSLRILNADTSPQKHDHFDLRLSGDQCLRLRDPRRFGAVVWTGEKPEQHPLLASLGPEPLSESFSGAYLHGLGKSRRTAIKSLIMDSRVVVGVGNIYASEALFRAGIHPMRASYRISATRYEMLASAIQSVLSAAIEQGGTTLRDFQREDGNPGYFAQSLRVYGRSGEHCPQCGDTIRSKVIGQRSSFYCPQCQR